LRKGDIALSAPYSLGSGAEIGRAVRELERELRKAIDADMILLLSRLIFGMTIIRNSCRTELGFLASSFGRRKEVLD
jgi:hypothetical protein